MVNFVGIFFFFCYTKFIYLYFKRIKYAVTLWMTVYITWECAYRVISKWCHSAAFGTDFSDIVDLSFSVGRLYAACILNETFLEIGVNVE